MVASHLARLSRAIRREDFDFQTRKTLKSKTFLKNCGEVNHFNFKFLAGRRRTVANFRILNSNFKNLK